LLRPAASENEQILVGRLFTVVFGICTILVAIVIPRAGGIVEVVLSIASIAGSALFAPIIWSLYSRRQTAFSVVTVTVVSLCVNLFFKFLSPYLLGLKLTRTWETVLGVGIPLLLLLAFELGLSGQTVSGIAPAVAGKDNDEGADAGRQNKFGVTVIAWAICFTGAGILLLGILAKGQQVVCWVGGGIVLAGLYILRLAGKYTA
jgi:Na+/proline symporter